MTKHIPNFITTLNLASGFVAIILASEGNLVAASWVIVAAMIFDFLDGSAARMLKAGSSIGKELDSLADVVSFGVAPAVILFRIMSPLLPESLYIVSPAIDYIPVIMAVCAAIRLAVFNTDPGQAKVFRGLPTPANAFAVAALVFAVSYHTGTLADIIVQSWMALLAYALVLSALMVSRIPLMSLKITQLGLRGNEFRILLAAVVLILMIIFGMGGTVYIIPLYITISLAETAMRNRKVSG